MVLEVILPSDRRGSSPWGYHGPFPQSNLDVVILVLWVNVRMLCCREANDVKLKWVEMS